MRTSFAENDPSKPTDVLTKEGTLSTDDLYEIREGKEPL